MSTTKSCINNDKQSLNSVAFYYVLLAYRYVAHNTKQSKKKVFIFPLGIMLTSNIAMNNKTQILSVIALMQTG